MLVTVSYARLQRQNCVVGEDVEKLKQRLSLLDYLRQQNWYLVNSLLRSTMQRAISLRREAWRQGQRVPHGRPEESRPAGQSASSQRTQPSAPGDRGGTLQPSAPGDRGGTLQTANFSRLLSA